MIEDIEAYRVVLNAIRSVDPQRAANFRRTTRWTTGRSLRDPLSKAPLKILAAIEQALADLPVGVIDR